MSDSIAKSVRLDELERRCKAYEKAMNKLCCDKPKWNDWAAHDHWPEHCRCENCGVIAFKEDPLKQPSASVLNHIKAKVITLNKEIDRLKSVVKLSGLDPVLPIPQAL